MPTLSRPADHVRPYGDDAPWNVAADTLATHPQSDSLVDKLWNDAPAARPGNFNLGFDDYTYPVYYAADATGMYTVDTVSWANLDGEKMPWNPAWTPAPGSDGQVIVLDAETGKEWNLWQVSFDGDVISASNGNLVPGNYFTKVDGFEPSRGVGIQYYAMLVQPEEIAAGEIAHALSMPIRNSAAQFVAPGTKSDGHTANGIPMGTRFELTVTDAEIDAWIDSLPDQLPASTLSSARVIAEALNDYGWFITDTAGGATWQFEARTTAGDLWTSLGLGATSVQWRNYPSDLMDGLLAPDRIRAIVPSDEYGSVPSPPPGPDTAAPTAALVGGSDITAETAAVQTLVVRYADNVAIDISSLDGNDIDVSGPAGTQSASLSSIDVNSDGTPRTATYTLAAPGGTWDASDNGTYTIALQGNEVEDTSGNGAAGGTLGTFAVAIASAPPQSGPVDLVAASGQFDVVEDPLAAGQAFDVQFAIENDGTGTAGTFDVEFFLSTNSWISANDHYLGSRTIDGVAGNGTSGTLTETLTLPAADDGFWRGDDTYYVGMLIDDADVIDETNESNNYRTGQGNDRDSVFVSLSSPPPPPEPDTAAPTAALVGGSDITAETAAVQTLVVRYADNVAIDISSLDGNDIDVSGPAGTQSASLSSIDVNSDGTPRTATYTLAAPGGTWDASDNGTYTIALQGNEVEDTSGNGAAGGTLGTFAVAIASAPPQSGPVDLVAASGQFDVVEDPLAAGQDFDVQFAIENDGTGTAGTFDVEFFLSTNSWISANDHYLGSRTIDGVAGNGTSGTLTETLTLPAADDGFWRGDDTYYIGMLIDDADVIDETNESNNYRTGQGNDYDSVFIA